MNTAPSPVLTAFAALARLKPDAAVDAGPLEADWHLAADVYADDVRLEQMLAAQAAFTLDLDRKAQAAYLIIEHSMLVATALVVPFVAMQIMPEISPDKVALRFSRAEVPYRGRSVVETKTAMRLISQGFSASDKSWQDNPHCRSLTDSDGLRNALRRTAQDYFSPLVRRLRACTALSEQAQWRLVGDSISAVFLEAGRSLNCEEAARQDALFVLKHPGSPLTNRQMHFFDIVIRDPADDERILLRRGFRSRGGCCRYYTSSEGHLCTTCVLLDPADRDRNLHASLTARFGLKTSTTQNLPGKG